MHRTEMYCLFHPSQSKATVIGASRLHFDNRLIE